MNLALSESEMAESPLMLIDDNCGNLHLLSCVLQWAGFTNLRSYTCARSALNDLATFDPHLIILDLSMPGMNGYEFLHRVREAAPPNAFTPILVYTADLTPEARNRALELGASDFLTKPGDAIEIKLRVRNFLRTRKMHTDVIDQNHLLEERVRERTEHLQLAWREAVELLGAACDYRDDDTGRHTHRVGELSAEIAAELGCSAAFVESIRLVAPLHDVGKIAIPDAILHKPSRLTDDEYESMKAHVEIGAALLSQKTSPLLQMGMDIAKYHHERWDGGGYCEGISGEGIPLCARIVCVADAFDAMTNDRPYRKGWTAERALFELNTCAGAQFDPEVVAAINRVMHEAVTSDRMAA